MRTRLQRLALLTALAASPLLGIAAPAQAAAPTRAANSQVDGSAVYVAPGGECGLPPIGYADFTDYPALKLDGDLDGCLYTSVEDSKGSFTDGVYVELGREVFVGTLNGGDPGTFETSYRFQGKFAAGAELFGRCQHPIVSGTGGFAGVTGRLDFKDIIEDPIIYVYRGHIRLP